MCTLELLTYNSDAPLKIGIDCAYMRVFVDWSEKLGKRTAWPATEIHRLEIEKDEPPFIVHLGNVWGIHVETCVQYVAMKRAKEELEDIDDDPSKT